MCLVYHLNGGHLMLCSLCVSYWPEASAWYMLQTLLEHCALPIYPGLPVDSQALVVSEIATFLGA